jgi:hypothetical protein
MLGIFIAMNVNQKLKLKSSGKKQLFGLKKYEPDAFHMLWPGFPSNSAS